MTSVDLLIYRIFSEDITSPLARRYKRLMKTCLLKKDSVPEYFDVMSSWQTLEAVLLCFIDLHQSGQNLPLTLEMFLDWARKEIEYREQKSKYEAVIDAAAAYFAENPKTDSPETIFDRVIQIGIDFAQENAIRVYNEITLNSGNVRKGDNNVKGGIKEALEEQSRQIAKINAVFEDDYDDVRRKSP